MKIGCAILAGGKSSRMGTDKAFLELDGKSFIQKLCEELDNFEEKIIARGARCEKGIVWNCISDIYPEKGPIGGLHAVLSVCQSEVMFCVSCDMPFLQRSLVEELCQQWNDDTDAVIAVTQDGRKHPLCGLYRKSVVSVLEEQILAGNYRMMGVLDKIKVNYVTITAENTQQLTNINTPQEYLTKPGKSPTSSV